MLKSCTKCSQVKSITEFTTDKQKKCGYRPICKECTNRQRRENRAKYRESERKYWSKPENKKRKYTQKQKHYVEKHYGITVKQYNSYFDYNKEDKKYYGTCSICNKVEERKRHGACLDHCHTTGKNRGVLCHSCNLALGIFNDSIESLQRAIDYLSK